MDLRNHDRNFGAVLAVWDGFGGSLALARDAGRVRFGVAGQGARAQRLSTIYLAPFAEAARALGDALSRLGAAGPA
ncbi:MAG: hypothetical protein VW405_21730, partial [Rhodospirillaceae bacterium]